MHTTDQVRLCVIAAMSAAVLIVGGGCRRVDEAISRDLAKVVVDTSHERIDNTGDRISFGKPREPGVIVAQPNIQQTSAIAGDIYLPVQPGPRNVTHRDGAQFVRLRAVGAAWRMREEARATMRSNGWTPVIAFQQGADVYVLAYAKPGRSAVLTLAGGTGNTVEVRMRLWTAHPLAVPGMMVAGR
ncbi:hypothetical protein [Montanilutibacter psychrotolerans]|uniref:Uncharacterized protein n=1 Tax=Montanilutibacter psychrotolerans TaxID=1327343 RepID=A0A3M8SY30_9GAMM|nr:hypothetical protein [Lysobacter psychrotolerans]RNF83770.1 hypothetical protein EER27_10390 [Lysobacter psychrotolerans]